MNPRISIDPAVCHGKPVIAGTRVLVANILADLAAGATPEQVVASYLNVTVQDIQAALEFGSALASFEEIPGGAAAAGSSCWTGASQPWRARGWRPAA